MPATLPITKYENANRSVTGTVAVEDSDVFLYCDTSLATGGATTINLKEIPGNYSSTLYKLYVKDNSANASVNNITIVAPAGFKINNQQSIVINVNEGLALIRIGSSTDYVAELNYGVVGDNAIVVKNTAYVMKNGSDTTGLIERFDKPFLTIVAAVNALRATYNDATRTPTNRFKVIVEDGTYTETSALYLYPYIDFDFGNSVIYAQILNNAVGVTYSSNPNNDYTTKIFGNARFYRYTSAVFTFGFSNESARILINCDTISSDRDDCINISDGYVKVICNKIYNDNTVNSFRQFSHAIEMSQGDTSRVSYLPCTLEIVGADIYMLNDQACTIHFATVGNSTTTLNQTLNLYNCRVINSLGSGSDDGKLSAIGVGVTHPEQLGSTLNLYNTVLYSKWGRSIFISNATSKANLTVYYYNLTNGNTDSYLAVTDATHTLTEYLKTTGFAISTDVLPIVP